jgi:hypothetical protein
MYDARSLAANDAWSPSGTTRRYDAWHLGGTASHAPSPYDAWNLRRPYDAWKLR